MARPSGVVNPKYESTFVFTNDFPALLEDVPHPEESTDPLFKTDVAKGTCRVMCFSPKSNVTVPLMETDELVKVVQVSKIGILFLTFCEKIFYFYLNDLTFSDREKLLIFEAEAEIFKQFEITR